MTEPEEEKECLTTSLQTNVQQPVETPPSEIVAGLSPESTLHILRPQRSSLI